MPIFLPALLRAFLVWLVIITTESLNGALRRLLLSPEVEFGVRQVSVVIGSIIIFAVTWLFMDWIKVRTTRATLAIGALWVVLTLAFEIALGRLTGAGWAYTLADYDLAHGGLMPLGLLAMGLTPWTVSWLQARRKRRPTAN